MAPPLVSILVPTYNHGRYIREALASLSSQTYAHWECIVVDDGSPDDTVDVARSIDDARVRVIVREHAGMDRLAETFNHALSAARGEFIGVCEGDDRWLPEKLEFQVPLLRDPSVVLTYARYAVIGTHGSVLTVPPLAGPRVQGPFQAFSALLEDSFAMLVTTLIRRDAIERIGGFQQLPGHGHIDYATWLRLARVGRFDARDRVVAEWRRHGASATIRAAAQLEFLQGPSLCRAEALRALEETTGPLDPRYAETRARIERSWERVLGRRHWQAARSLAAQGSRAAAIRLFSRGLRLHGLLLTQRLQLAAGLLMTALGLDIESVVARVRGGSALRDLN